MATVSTSRVNLATNPSMETTSGTVNVRTNLCPNPNFELDGNFWSGVNSSAVTSSTQAWSGTKSFQVTLSTQASASQTGINLFTALAANTTYTYSGFVYVPAGNPMINIQIQASGFTAAYGTKTTATGVWQRISVTFTTTTAQSYACYFLNDTASTSGQIFYLDGVLLEQTSLLQPYFDGSTPITNRILNPDFEVDASRWFAEAGAVFARDTTNPISGSASGKLVGGSGSGDVYANITGFSIGETYTLSLDYKAPITPGGVQKIQIVEVGGTGRVWTTVLPTSQLSPARFSVTSQPIGVGVTNVVAVITHSSNSQPVWFDNVLVEASATAGPYYSGQGDFTYVWSGTANASTSYQQAPGVAVLIGGGGVTGMNAAMYKSTMWATRASSASLRITPYSGNSAAAVTAQTGLSGLTPGNTYTISATFYQSAAQTGTLNSRARSILVDQNNGSTYWSALSAPAPNVPGPSRVSVTFTVNAAATNVPIYLYNGADAGGGDVWWDDVLIEQASTLGSYFDGNTATVTDNTYAPAATRSYSWTSTPNASTSIETLSVPLQNYQVQAPDGTIVGANTKLGLLEVVGLRGSATTRSADLDRAGLDGMAPGMSFVTGRTVAVKWLIFDPAGVETELQILARNWQNTNDPSTVVMTARDYLLQLAGGGSRAVSALQFQLPGRSVPLLALGKPGKLDPPVNSSYQFGWLEVASDWFVPDGKIYDTTVNTATVGLPASLGGAKFAWTFPVNFGPSTGGTLQVVNNGLYPAKPVFKVTGPVTNPKISNPATGQFVRVNLALVAGDVLVIDSDSRVVRLNGVNRNNALDVNSSFFTIPPGGTSLSFASTDGGTVAGTLTAYTLNTYSTT